MKRLLALLATLPLATMGAGLRTPTVSVQSVSADPPREREQTAMPADPTRAELLRFNTNFQGYYCNPRDVASGPAAQMVWEPLITSMSPERRREIYVCKKAARHTHIDLSLDLTGLEGLPPVLDVAEEAIRAGFWPVLHLMGDGNGYAGTVVDTREHVDPGALGYHWLVENFAAIQRAIEQRGLRKKIVRVPAYDGMIPQWMRPDGPDRWKRVVDFIRFARPILGDDAMCAYMSAGFGHSYSGGTDDFHTADGQMWDCVLIEAPAYQGPPDRPAPPNWFQLPEEEKHPWTYVWGPAKRALGPFWIRDQRMPPGEDEGRFTGGPSTVTTPRGPMVVAMYEYLTYQCIRRHGCPDDAFVERYRQYFRSLGYSLVN